MPDVKLFSDFEAALRQAAIDVAALANIPKKQRRQYLETISDAYRLMDTTLSLVINRVTELVNDAHEGKLLRYKVGELAYYQPWLDAERHLRLCDNLRFTGREMRSIPGHVAGRFSTHDWEALRELFETFTEGEAALARKIAATMDEVAARAGAAATDTEVLEALQEARSDLQAERRRLIEAELAASELV